jgi:class 3 adenylate cyclase
VLVAWPLHEGACAKEAACAAAACALAMLRLQHSSPAAGEPPLSLHIAIHAGDLAELHVGNGDTPGGRWEHMLAGAPLSELAPLVAAAAPGECMASHAVWALLQGSATAGALCAGGARVLDVVAAAAASQHGAGCAGNDDGPSDQTLSALGCYLPPALADTLEAGEQRWMAELRQCSVLFILLPPCGAGDFLLAQALIAEVHTCVQRYGGACQQSLCDDKGMVSIGVWGRPPESFADDPSRAVAAAVELAASLKRIAAAHGRSDPIGCGVTTGRAFCGNIGAASRTEWSVVGDVMNNAARLMTSALMLSRAVLCCAVTARHVAAFTAEEGGQMPAWLSAAPLSVALKGCATPMAVFAPLPAEAVPSPRPLLSSSAEAQHRRHSGGDFEESDARRGDARRAAAILGREAELAHVAELLADESVRAGALMVVSGALPLVGAPLVSLALTSLCVIRRRRIQRQVFVSARRRRHRFCAGAGRAAAGARLQRRL